MLAAMTSMSLAAAPSGTYTGSISILGVTLDASIETIDATHAKIDISGAVTVDCASEAVVLPTSSGAITLPNIGTAGDCAHDALSTNDASISSIMYDSDADTVTIKAKKSFIPVTLTLKKAAGMVVEQVIDEAASSVLFSAFEKHHGKMYTDEERPFRYATFVSNLEMITARNQDGEMGTHWVNEFADLSPEEFKARFLGYQPKMSLFGREEVSLPESVGTSVDWRSSKYLTGVKDQGQCGSCWAFSATEQIESDVAFATGKLLTLSPQQITSCDKVDQGCNGGNTETAYAYVKKAGGLESAAEYPYSSGNAGKSGKCKATKGDAKATITGFSTISKTKTGEKKMMTQIKKSPISVCVDASTWQTYDSGIVGKSCKAQLDHCVQAVGYHAGGANGGKKDYWIVRNSWGTSWGEEGYIFVQSGLNACGIAMDATVTTGASLVTSDSPVLVA